MYRRSNITGPYKKGIDKFYISDIQNVQGIIDTILREVKMNRFRRMRANNQLRNLVRETHLNKKRLYISPIRS